MKLVPAWLKWTLPVFVLAAVCYIATWAYAPANLPITPADTNHLILNPHAAKPNLAQMIILESRLPRILTAVLCGAVLAVSGLLLQTMTRNPLASPSLLSINAGASLGIILTGVFLTGGDYSLTVTAATINHTAYALTIGLILFGVYIRYAAQNTLLTLACILGGFALIIWQHRHPAGGYLFAQAVEHFLRGTRLSAAAAIGGALSWCLVMYISYKDGRLQQNRLILAGIAVSAFCIALGRASLLLDETQASGVMRWLAGSLSNLTWARVHQYWPWVAIPILPLLWLIPKLNILRLSDDAAQTLGLSVRQLRLAINLIVLVWIGASVAITGPIAFIGLLVPHAAQHWIGYDLRAALPMSALLGALLLTGADLLATALSQQGQLPAGAVLAIIGAPCFVLLAKRRSDQ